MRDAGLTSVEVEARVLPVTFDGGPPQMIATLAASPIATNVAELDDPGRARLVEALAKIASPLIHGGQVTGDVTANIAVASV